MAGKGKNKDSAAGRPRNQPPGIPAGVVSVPISPQPPQGMTVVQALALAARCHETGKPDEAEALLKQVLAARPQNAAAWHLRGMIALGRGRLGMAADCVGRAIQQDGNVALFYVNMTEINRQLKRLDDAIICGKKAVLLDPQFALAHRNLGVAYYDRQEYEKAEACQREALKADPAFAPALNNLGSIFQAREDHETALDFYRRAIAAKPGYSDAINNMASALRHLGRLREALAVVDGLLAKQPSHAAAQCNRGLVLASLNRPAEARQCFEAALKLRPDYPEAQLGLGNLLLEAGRLEEAEKFFRALIASGNCLPGALTGLLQVRKVMPGDDEIGLLEREAAQARAEGDKMTLQFALGKAYDDLGAAEKAFPFFMEGCRIKRRHLRCDIAQRERLFESIAEIFSAELIRQHEGKGYLSETPVFVLGMPRSGTSLVEQIISSHPEAYGAGEIPDLREVVGSLIPSQQGPFPDNIPALNQEALTEMGEKYVSGLRVRHPDARRIVDKMPINFIYIGLIHLMLPRAKIIHVSRHPLDTCLSCFTRLFVRENQEFSYDLAELGRYYRNYARLMDHWRRVLPAGAFHDLSYERLTEDTEAETRRLIAYCGLEWDDRCLDFHKTERNVCTPSAVQVRQPVYKSSVARWKKYERFLGPLIEELGDALPPE